MPIRHRTSNRVLPANSRAVDVAKRAIQDITPIQQRRYHNAFQVQGYEALVYNRLTNGVPCSCQAQRSVLGSLLNEDGKMPEGKMNELLTGGLTFSINRYKAERTAPLNPQRAEQGLGDLPRDEQFFGSNDNENDNIFEIAVADRDGHDPFASVTAPDGANGPNQPYTLDDITDDFDGDGQDHGGTRCTCCFGTGYVGGYSLLGGWRKVIAPHMAEVYSVQGVIQTNVFPNTFEATQVVLRVTLPKGFVVLDAFTLWNNVERVIPQRMFIDNLPYSPPLFSAMCDGREHEIRIEFNDLGTPWTHLEMQVGLSRESALIEFPRLTQGSRLELADLIEDVTINASPVIPHLATKDVFVESTFGKTFIISSANLWNDRARNVHGWDCQTRVIQPSELLSFLPRRRKLAQRTTNPVRDNTDGPRRT